MTKISKIITTVIEEGGSVTIYVGIENREQNHKIGTAVKTVIEQAIVNFQEALEDHRASCCGDQN